METSSLAPCQIQKKSAWNKFWFQICNIGYKCLFSIYVIFIINASACNFTHTSKSGNFSSWRGFVAWRILHICWVSSRETSSRSPSIISSSSWARAISLRASTGCSSCRGTNGVLRTCFLHPPNPSLEAENIQNFFPDLVFFH